MTLPLLVPVTRPAAFAPEARALVPRIAGRPGLVFFHGHEQSSRLAHYFLAAPLARGETVLFLDAANCFDPYRLAKWARKWQQRMEMLRKGRKDLPQRAHPSTLSACGGLRSGSPLSSASLREDTEKIQRTSRSLDCAPTDVGASLGMTSVEEVLRRVRVSRAFTCFQMAELIERVPAAARRYGTRRVVLTGFPDIFDDEEIPAAQARAAFARIQPHFHRWAALRLRALAFSDRAAKPSPLRRWLMRELGRSASAVYRLEEGPAGLALREERVRGKSLPQRAHPSTSPPQCGGSAQGLRSAPPRSERTQRNAPFACAAGLRVKRKPWDGRSPPSIN